MTILSTISSLASEGSNFANESIVYVKWHSVAEDLGGGYFRLDNSGALGASAEDGGVVVATNGPVNSYWRRQIVGDLYIPQWWGAKGDNSTNDSTAVQDAADYCEGLNTPTVITPVLYFPRSAGYRCTSTITIKENIHVLMDSPIIHNGTEATAGLVIGTTAIANRELDMRLKCDRVALSDWTDVESVGVKVLNADSCKISVSASQWTIGFQAMGSSAGFSNSRITLQRVVDNRYDVNFTNENTGSGNGFCNDNLFISGRVANGGVKPGLTRFGIWGNSKDATNLVNNNNVFLKPVIELRDDTASGTTVSETFTVDTATNEIIDANHNRVDDDVVTSLTTTGTLPAGLALSTTYYVVGKTSGRFKLSLTEDGPVVPITTEQSGDVHTYNSPGRAIPCLFEDASDNEVIRARNEGNNAVFAQCKKTATNNLFEFGHTDGTIVQLGTAAGNTRTFSGKPASYAPLRMVFDSGNMADNAVIFDSGLANDLHIPGVHMARSNVATRKVSEQDVIAFVAEVFVVDTGTNELVDTAHSLANGDVFYITTSDTPPGGLAIATKYYVVGKTTDRFQASLTLGGSAEPISTSGAGEHKYHSRNRYVEFSLASGTHEGVGVNIDTSVAKQFVVETDTEVGFGGRVKVAAYDSNGELLTDDPTPEHVHGDFNFFWTAASFGGTYGTGSDRQGLDVHFQVRAAVKSISLILSGGTTGLHIRRFRVFTPDIESAPRTWLDYEAGEPGRSVVAEAPAAGVYVAGRTVWDYTPASAAQMGWVCTVGGAPGTWVAMPNFA